MASCHTHAPTEIIFHRIHGTHRTFCRDILPQNTRNTQNLLAEKRLPQISQIYTETFSKKVLCALRILWEFLYTNLKAIEVLG